MLNSTSWDEFPLAQIFNSTGIIEIWYIFLCGKIKFDHIMVAWRNLKTLNPQ